MDRFFVIGEVNLFSIMVGMSIVVLSSMYRGRLRCTRLVFFYLAYLVLYYSFLGPNHIL